MPTRPQHASTCGHPRLIESMRYKGPDSPAKTLWLNEALTWGTLNGQPICTVAALTWLDEGRPWAEFKVEDVRYNVAMPELYATKSES